MPEENTPVEDTPGGGEHQDDRHDERPDLGQLTVEAARKLQNDARASLKRAKQAETELERLRQASMSGEDKRQQQEAQLHERLTTLEQTNRMLRVRAIAGELGVVDTEAAALLLRWDAIDDPDDEKAVKRALKALTADRPWLLGSRETPSIGAGEGRSERPRPNDMDQIIRRAAGRT